MLCWRRYCSRGVVIVGVVVASSKLLLLSMMWKPFKAGPRLPLGLELRGDTLPSTSLPIDGPSRRHRSACCWQTSLAGKTAAVCNGPAKPVLPLTELSNRVRSSHFWPSISNFEVSLKAASWAISASSSSFRQKDRRTRHSRRRPWLGARTSSRSWQSVVDKLTEPLLELVSRI